ncbi:MAG: tetratricopeptide repeat-containing protein [Verrucomicrobiaceae bacterium]|nr:MAG: tetratricopeptide repeat-containing protein [Verrucomicrobiaceae bacterium]
MSTAPPTESKATPEAPWLGLAHFTAAEREYFHGREKEIRELADRARRASLTILYGVSGYGKSSLLGAGLIPTLEADDHAVILLRRCYDDLPRRPLEGDVMKAVATGYPGAVLPEQETLWEFFHDRRQPWFSGSGEYEDSDPPRVMLVFDQFEEIFTRGEDRTTTDKRGDENARRHAKQFLTQLADVVENRTPDGLRERLRSGTEEERRALLQAYDFQSQPVGVVLSLRDDFLARLERWRRVMPRIMEHRVELRMLAGLEAYDAVYLPGAKRTGLPPIIPPEIAAAIVRAAAGVPGDVPLEDIEAVPPILSLLCERLNSRRLAASQPASRIVAADFDSTEASRILGTFYGEKLDSQPGALREFIEDELVSDNGFRESRLLASSLADLRDKVPDAEQRLRQLVDDRILVIEVRAGMERVEFTHDTLAKLALENRQRRESRRKKIRMLRWAGIASGLVVGSFGMAVWALSQKAQAEHQKSVADKATAMAMLAAENEAKAKASSERASESSISIASSVLSRLDPEKDAAILREIQSEIERKMMDDPSSPGAAAAVLNLWIIRGNASSSRGKTEYAMAEYRAGLEISRAKLAGYPTDYYLVFQSVFLSNRLAELRSAETPLTPEAQADIRGYFNDALAWIEASGYLGTPSGDHYWGLTCGKLGTTFYGDDPTKAVEYYDRALERLAHVGQNSTYKASNDNFMASFLRARGDAEMKLKQSGKARASYLKAVDLYRTMADAADSSGVLAQQGLGVIYGGLANLANTGSPEEKSEAVELSRQSVRYFETYDALSPGVESRKALSGGYDHLGFLLQERGDLAGALEMYKKSLPLREQLLALHPDDSHLRRLLAQLYRWMGIINGGTNQAERLRLYALSADTLRPLLVKEPVSIDDRFNYLANIFDSSEVLGVSGDAGQAKNLRRECHKHILLIPSDKLDEFWDGVAAKLKAEFGQ